MLSCQSLVPAHQGVKTGVLTGAGVCGSFATHTPTLDSGLRRNDELGGRNDECEGIPTDAGLTRPTVVAGTIHPGSESGTCFRANDDVRFADYRNGLGVLTVSINCLSAWENALEVPNIKEVKTPGRCTAVRTCVSTLARITGHFRIV